MFRLSLLCSLLFCLQALSAQQAAYREQFNENIQTADSLVLRELLSKWEKAAPDDPELYPAHFNYCIRFASQGELQAGGNLSDGICSLSVGEEKDILLAAPENDSVPADCVHEGIRWNEDLVELGLAWIDRGISAHPDRLDFRFGKVSLLMETEEYSAAVSEMEEILLRANGNGNRWLWTDNEPLEEPVKFMQKGMQGCFHRLYSLKSDEGNTCANNLLDILLTHYPKNVMFRADQGVLYVSQEMYRPALEQFLSVLEETPDNFPVMSNAGYTYILMGDKLNAEFFYKRLLERCQDEALRKDAQERLKQLKKK